MRETAESAEVCIPPLISILFDLPETQFFPTLPQTLMSVQRVWMSAAPVENASTQKEPMNATALQDT